MNAIDLENGESALHYAVKADEVELCALLVSKKADWNHLKNKEGLTPYRMAQELKHPDIVEFFSILSAEVRSMF